MEKVITEELLKYGVFALLFVSLVWYVLKDSKNRELKQDEENKKRENKLYDVIDKTNKININVTETNKELSETNRILAQNLTNDVGTLKVQVEHIDDKLDDLKSELRSK